MNYNSTRNRFLFRKYTKHVFDINVIISCNYFLLVYKYILFSNSYRIYSTVVMFQRNIV